jgi:NAD(P) transhydrogenase subunit alpha
MSTDSLVDNVTDLANKARDLADQAAAVAMESAQEISAGGHASGGFETSLTVFILACFVGYYVVWRVTPALHSPLMAVTNAISSVIIVGALLAVGSAQSGFSQLLGFLAVTLAAVNISGGFIVSRRMLHMFKKKEG